MPVFALGIEMQRHACGVQRYARWHHSGPFRLVGGVGRRDDDADLRPCAVNCRLIDSVQPHRTGYSAASAAMPESAPITSSHRHDVGEADRHAGQAGVVDGVGIGGVAVRHHDHVEITHHGVARGRLAADIGECAGHRQGIDAPGAQPVLDIRRALNEGAEAALDHPHVPVLDIHRRPQGMPLGAFLELADYPLRHLQVAGAAEEGRPFGEDIVVEGGINPDDRSARGPERRRQAIDVGHDLPRLRHLRWQAGFQEGRLHIDHDQRGARRIERVADMQPAAAPGPDEPDRVRVQFGLVHPVLPFRPVRAGPSPVSAQRCIRSRHCPALRRGPGRSAVGAATQRPPRRMPQVAEPIGERSGSRESRLSNRPDTAYKNILPFFAHAGRGGAR